MSEPIPQPPPVPLLGNIRDVDPNNAMASLDLLAEKYGEIFKLSAFGRDRYFVSSVELINEVCNEKRFRKSVGGGLNEVRNGVGDGLFTARHNEPNWGAAHRTLVPAFGPLPIKAMYDEMYDIATQLVAKWARMGPDEPIVATEDFTRLAFDSIALCSMGKRFNSFYSNETPQFVTSMANFLLESGKRAQRTRIESLFYRDVERRYWADIEYMRKVAQDVINFRRANPSDKKDLLNALLFSKDPQTGLRLSDESIMNNMITFLIAGHETTAGLLSFAFYFMIKNPEKLQKAQKEVDDVVGKNAIRYEHISKLPYVEAVLRETLRLQPSAPGIAMEPLGETSDPVILAGKYTVPSDATIVCLLRSEGKDPSVYGADAAEFKPERMYKENFANLPSNAWKPFGNGARGCIGRPFAWQEAVLAVSLILQNFNVRMDDPSYQLKIRQTLTIKPDGFCMKAALRDGIDAVHLEKRMYSGADTITDDKHTPLHPSAAGPGGKPLTILYGGNSGTCEGLAQSLAGSASTHGFTADVKSMDSAVDALPRDQPVIVVTASYEGQPPDNAAAFVQWLKTVDQAKIEGTRFAVFGCGHKDWVATYQKIPTLVDTELSAKGGKAIIARGGTDVATGTIFDDFDGWTDQLWAALSDGDVKSVTSEGLDVEINTTSRAAHLRHSVQDALVLKNELLTAPGVPEKRHVEIRLPTDMTYQSGDYLALLPINNIPTISRVLKRFNLPWDAMMRLRKNSHTTIPTDQDLPIIAVLGAYVELKGTATRKNITTLVQHGGDETKLAGMSSKSVLEILEKHPEIQLPFGVYLAMLTPMRIRQYSISSSPLQDASIASITYSVVQGEEHLGVATNYLRDVKPGSIIQVSIKKSHASFHLPNDDSTPVIMAAAGTGLAPFHGFAQERAAKIAAGKKLGEAALFIGCRSPKEDKLYADQFAQWEKDGVVKTYYAYSRASEESEGCKYAQDRLWKERAEVSRLFDAGARAYVCGSARLGKGISDVVARIGVERTKAKGVPKDYDQCLAWWEALRGERYAVDVFD